MSTPVPDVQSKRNPEQVSIPARRKHGNPTLRVIANRNPLDRVWPILDGQLALFEMSEWL